MALLCYMLLVLPSMWCKICLHMRAQLNMPNTVNTIVKSVRTFTSSARTTAPHPTEHWIDYSLQLYAHEHDVKLAGDVNVK